jgi:hypothetical protein
MQYFTVRNDPLNSLLDMLPGYALEMRSQDIQRKQEKRRMRLAEKTQREESGRAERGLEMRETAFGWTEFDREQDQKRKRSLSEFLDKNINAQRDYRNKHSEWTDYKKRYAGEYDRYKEVVEGKTPIQHWGGFISGKPLSEVSFVDYLERQTDPGRMTSRNPKWDKMLKEFKALPELEIDLPEYKAEVGMYIDPMSYNISVETMKSNIEEDINQLFEQFGGVGQLQSDVRFGFEGGRTQVDPNQTAQPGLWDYLTGGVPQKKFW